MKKVLTSILAAGILFGGVTSTFASTTAGASYNTSKALYAKADQHVVLNIQNDNKHRVSGWIKPQVQSANGKWSDVSWDDHNYINSKQKISKKYLLSKFKFSGTYRFKYTVVELNEYNGEIDEVVGYTETFKVRK